MQRKSAAWLCQNGYYFQMLVYLHCRRVGDYGQSVKRKSNPPSEASINYGEGVFLTPSEYPRSIHCKLFTEDEGRNRTRKLYHSEPNTLCFKAYFTLISQGFKLFFYRPSNARSLPGCRPFIARQVKN